MVWTLILFCFCGSSPPPCGLEPKTNWSQTHVLESDRFALCHAGLRMLAGRAFNWKGAFRCNCQKLKNSLIRMYSEWGLVTVRASAHVSHQSNLRCLSRRLSQNTNGRKHGYAITKQMFGKTNPTKLQSNKNPNHIWRSSKNQNRQSQATLDDRTNLNATSNMHPQ